MKKRNKKRVREQQLQVLLVFICFASGIILTGLTIAAVLGILSLTGLTDIIYNSLLVPGEDFIDGTGPFLLALVVIPLFVSNYSKISAKILIHFFK